MEKANKYLNQLVALNQTQRVLTILQRITQNDQNLQRFTIGLSARYNELMDQKKKGLISQSEFGIEYNSIQNGLLEIIDELPEGTVLDESRLQERIIGLRHFLLQQSRLVVFTILLGLFAVLVFLFYTPKANVSVEFELLANQIAFHPQKPLNIDINTKLQLLEIRNFDNILIPADEIFLKNPSPLPKAYQSSLYQPISIKPTPGENCSLTFRDSELQSLRINQNTKITFSTTDELGKATQLRIDSKPGRMAGLILLPDTSHFSAENLIAENFDSVISQVNLGPGWNTAWLSRENAFCSFQGDANDKIASVNLWDRINVKSDLSLVKARNLTINHLDFQRNTRHKSSNTSIIKGSGHFKNNKGNSYQAFELTETDYLKTEKEDEIFLLSLNLKDGNTLAGKFQGKIGKLYSGPNQEEFRLLNPSYLEWLWQNHPLSILILSISMLFFFSLFIVQVYDKRSRLVFIRE